MLSFNWLESHPAEEVHVDEKPPEEGGNDKITGAEEYTYTYLVSGWDRSTDIPLLPTDDQASGPGMIVVLLLLLLLVLGRNRSENFLLTLTHSSTGLIKTLLSVRSTISQGRVARYNSSQVVGTLQVGFSCHVKRAGQGEGMGEGGIADNMVAVIYKLGQGGEEGERNTRNKGVT